MSHKNEGGFVLVVAVMMLLIMTTLGIGLLRYTQHEIEQIDSVDNSFMLFNSAESCIAEATKALENLGKSAPPCLNQAAGKGCKTVTSHMNKWSQASDLQKLKSKSGSQSYTCNIRLLSTEAAEGSGTGFEIGQQNVYGGVSNKTKYLYLIEAEATDSAVNKSIKIDAVASMVY